MTLPNFPNYTLENIVARDGLGTIYAATHNPTQAAVWIRTLLPVYYDSHRTRFVEGFRTLEKLSHPSLPTIQEVVVGESIYVVQASLPSQHLRHIALPLPEQEVIRLFSQILEGFQIAHAHDLLHPFLSPLKIYLGENPVIDGLEPAHLIPTENMVGGNPMYCAPEFFQGNSVTHQANLYSLGIMMFEALTGNFPFEHETIMQLAMAHMKNPIPSVGDFGEKWDGFFVKALAKNPEERFQGAGEMLIAMKNV